MTEILDQVPSELVWALAIYALAIPVELLFGTGGRPTVYERLGNVLAMFLNFAAGGLLLTALLSRPEAAGLMGFSDEPRFAVLRNPWLYAFAAVFSVDALYYVYHRLQHTVPLLWHIHALHHTDPAVNITTSRRTHFLERPIQYLILVTPVLFLLGFSAEGLAVMAVLGPGLLYFSHLDVKLSLGPLTSLVVGPQYHRIHHALDARNHGVNFAQAFPLFDWIGGTYRAPRPREFVATGIEGCKTAADRWRPVVW